MNRSLSFPVEQLLEARSGAVCYRERIVDGCNFGSKTEPHSFKMTIDATFSANTRKGSDKNMQSLEVGWGFDGGDVTRHDTFDITVDCLGPPRHERGPQRRSDPHRTKVTATGIDLFLQTFAIPASSQHGPSGTQCKPLKVTTRVATDKAGPVNVKLWRQVNGGADHGRSQADAGAKHWAAASSATTGTRSSTSPRPPRCSTRPKCWAARLVRRPSGRASPSIAMAISRRRRATPIPTIAIRRAASRRTRRGSRPS